MTALWICTILNSASILILALTTNLLRKRP